MKVLHIAHSVARAYGGPTQSLVGYVAAARIKGIESTVLAPDPGEADRLWLAARDPHTVFLFFRQVGRAAFSLAPHMLNWIDENVRSFDVVHVHGLFNPVSSLGGRRALKWNVPVIIRPFGTLSRYTFSHRRSRLKRLWFARVEKENLERAAGIHFTTERERDESAWRSISFGSRAFVVPPPLHSETTPEPPAKTESCNVLFLGRLNPVKNLEALIRAWPQVVTTNPKATLVIAGEGSPSYREHLELLALNSGVNDTITFEGFVHAERKAELLSRAAVMVLPSHHENFGIVVLEAIVAGVPVIVSQDVQLADFIRREGFGTVVEGNSEQLSSAITAAIANRELKARVARTGWETVNRHFSTRMVSDLLESMYRTVAATRKQAQQAS